MKKYYEIDMYRKADAVAEIIGVDIDTIDKFVDKLVSKAYKVKDENRAIGFEEVVTVGDNKFRFSADASMTDKFSIANIKVERKKEYWNRYDFLAEIHKNAEGEVSKYYFASEITKSIIDKLWNTIVEWAEYLEECKAVVEKAVNDHKEFMESDF